MAKDKVIGREDNASTGSTPAGNGGRVRRNVYLNDEGIDLAIDPDGSRGYTYSGMTKRMAIETGSFNDIHSRDEE